MRETYFSKVIALSLFLAIGLPVYGWAGEPTEKIKQTTDKILKIVTDPSLKHPSKAQERKRRSLLVSSGIYWKGLT